MCLKNDEATFTSHQALKVKAHHSRSRTGREMQLSIIPVVESNKPTHLRSGYLLGYQMEHLQQFCFQEGDSAFQELTSQLGTENKDNIHDIYTYTG